MRGIISVLRLVDWKLFQRVQPWVVLGTFSLHLASLQCTTTVASMHEDANAFERVALQVQGKSTSRAAHAKIWLCPPANYVIMEMDVGGCIKLFTSASGCRMIVMWIHLEAFL